MSPSQNGQESELREGKNSIVGGDILLLAAVKFFGFAPWQLALSCLMAGFGSLSAFYAVLALRNSPLLRWRGLYSYYSATIGDGLLLPMAVAVSAATLLNMQKLLELALKSRDTKLKDRAYALKARLSQRSLKWIPVGLAFITTAVVHTAWLLNPHTEPNWTIAAGRLNFFGYWHGGFFFFVLWWFLAFLARLILVTQSLLRPSDSQSMASASLHIWGDVNAVLAILAGFASLVYVDNYGLRFSWRPLLENVTTLTFLLFTTSVLITVNLYFALWIYRPVLLKRSGKERNELERLVKRGWTAFAFGCLLVIALLVLVHAISAVIAWPLAAVLTGLVFPVLVAENYAADLFWNHKRVPDSVQCLGICMILIISSAGLLTATALSLGSTQVETITQMLPSWSANMGVSLVTALVCIAAAWMASLTIEGKHLTDHTPMYNISQNFLEYWGLFQIVVIPTFVFVYRQRAGLLPSLSTEARIALIGGFSASIFAIVGFPLRNNFEHLRDLEKRRSKYPSFHRISNHILFISIYVGAVTLFMLGWLWISALDAIAKAK